MDINGYLDLVPTENSREIYNEETSEFEASKYMRFLRMILEPGMDLHSMATNYSAFDVNIAAGNQLDVLGDIIGINRKLPYVPASGNSEMSDEEYRIVLRLRIAQESWSGGNAQAEEIYTTVIGDAISMKYTDNMDCSVNIELGADSLNMAQILDMVDGYLVPAGVNKNLNISIVVSGASISHGIQVTGEEYENYVEIRSEI